MIFVLGLAFFLDWREQNKTNYIGEILDSIPSIDLIIVKDSESDKSLFEYTNKDPFFMDIVNIYKHSYYELKQSEKKLLNKEPTYNIEFLQDNKIQYKVNIYLVNEDTADVFVDKGFSNEYVKYDYIYSPENANHSYVLALEKYHLVVGLNNGLKQIINRTLIQ